MKARSYVDRSSSGRMYVAENGPVHVWIRDVGGTKPTNVYLPTGSIFIHIPGFDLMVSGALVLGTFLCPDGISRLLPVRALNLVPLVN